MLRGGSFAAVCPRPGRRRKHTFSWGACGRNPTVFSQFLQTDSTRNQKNVRIMAFFKEFKEFALKGNVMDMAVGVIIGGAFKGITDSLVNDILNPVLGIFAGDNEALAGLAIPLPGGGDLMLGSFLNAILSFLIMAFVVFCIVKLLNRLHKKEEAAPPPPPKPSAEEALLTEIRDLLKEQKNG